MIMHKILDTFDCMVRRAAAPGMDVETPGEVVDHGFQDDDVRRHTSMRQLRSNMDPLSHVQGASRRQRPKYIILPDSTFRRM